MNPYMSFQFVASTEGLATMGKRTGVRLLPRVCSNVSLLVLQSVETSGTDGTPEGSLEVIRGKRGRVVVHGLFVC